MKVLLQRENTVFVPSANDPFTPIGRVPEFDVELKERSCDVLVFAGSAHTYPHSDIRPAPVCDAVMTPV